MPKSRTWVVKLGGAMMRAPELGHWLDACLSDDARTRCVVIPGGGGLADEIRRLHAAWNFDSSRAHALAVDAMRMNAEVLRMLAPTARAAPGPARDADGRRGGRDFVWSPPTPWAPRDLPQSWAATSDSIALFVAQALSADALFLVKSVAAEDLHDAAAAELSRAGLIDEFFPQLLARAPVPTRVLSKSQHALFSVARGRGALGGAAVR